MKMFYDGNLDVNVAKPPKDYKADPCIYLSSAPDLAQVRNIPKENHNIQN